MVLPRRAHFHGSLLVFLAAGCGVRIKPDDRMLTLRGDPQISEERRTDGTFATTVRIPVTLPRAEQMTFVPEGAIDAEIGAPGWGHGPVYARRVSRPDGEWIEATFDELPPKFGSATLRVSTRDDEGGFHLRGLRVSAPRPRLPSRVETPLGMVEAIGVRDLGVKTSRGSEFGGIALDLPPAPGYIRRLREFGVAPAYGRGPRPVTSFYVRSSGYPAMISNEGYAYQRWEAAGTLELMVPGPASDAYAPESPVTIAKEGAHWTVLPPAGLPDDEDLQLRADVGEWQELGTGTHFDRKPGSLLVRRLRVARAARFAVQAQAINDVDVAGRDRIRPNPLNVVYFDYAREIARRNLARGLISNIRERDRATP